MIQSSQTIKKIIPLKAKKMVNTRSSSNAPKKKRGKHPSKVTHQQQHRVLRQRHVRNTNDNIPLVCCVCLENISIISISTFCSLIQCKQCNNIFHERCFRKFMNVSEYPSCPLCKKGVDDLNTGWEINSTVVDTFYESDEESYVFSDNTSLTSMNSLNDLSLPFRNLRNRTVYIHKEAVCEEIEDMPYQQDASLRQRIQHPERRITRSSTAC